jgi:hypothetical protein
MNLLLTRSSKPAVGILIVASLEISRSEYNRRKSRCDDEKVLAIAKRLKRMIRPEDRKKFGSNLSLEERRAFQQQKSLTHIRAVDFEVDVPIQEVEILWTNQIARQRWDTLQCSKVSSEQSPPGMPPVFHLIAQPGYLLPARDYVFRFIKAPTGVVGLNDFRAMALFAVDSPNDLPRSWFYVRGNMNSLMLLVPNGSKTSITYVVEFSYNGEYILLQYDIFVYYF